MLGQFLFPLRRLSSCVLVTAGVWLARFRFGPLEWTWRSLTYARRQPMRVAPADVVSTVQV